MIGATARNRGMVLESLRAALHLTKQGWINQIKFEQLKLSFSLENTFMAN